MSGAEDSTISPTLRLATRGPLFDCRAALWARLELAFPAKQFGRAILPAKPTPATWQRVLTKPPLVGICWLGLRPDEKSGRVLRCSADWVIYLACRNELPQGLLTGDTYGVGMLGMAGLAAALLHQWVVPDLGVWSVDAIDNAALQDFVDEEIGIVALQASCRLSLIDEDAAAALPEFLQVGAQWDLPPLGGDTVDVRMSP